MSAPSENAFSASSCFVTCSSSARTSAKEASERPLELRGVEKRGRPLENCAPNCGPNCARRLLGEVAALELALQRGHLALQLLLLRRARVAHELELRERFRLLLLRAPLVRRRRERLLAELLLPQLLRRQLRLVLVLDLEVRAAQLVDRVVDRPRVRHQLGARPPGKRAAAAARRVAQVLELQLEEVHLLLQVVDVLLLQLAVAAAAAAAGAVVGLGTPVRGCGAPPTVTDGLTGASMPYIFGARYCALLMRVAACPSERDRQRALRERAGERRPQHKHRSNAPDSAPARSCPFSPPRRRWPPPPRAAAADSCI